MFEKVNPSHPDKVADRIAGAIVDLCYTKSRDPKVASEVLIGHGECNIQVETSEQISAEDIEAIVSRIAGEGFETRALIVPQDIHLAANQQHGVRCGDNGIFRGVPPTYEQKVLTALAATMYENIPYDGKYIINRKFWEEDPDYVSYGVTVCQSHATQQEICMLLSAFEKSQFDAKGIFCPIDEYTINPLGEWTGGPDTDSGATNRKLGSDMGDGVTGGGLHGKDLSKADVSVNIVAHMLAQQTGQTVTATCSIGDEEVAFRTADGDTITLPFADIVERARLYVLTNCGSFERLAEYGLIA